RTNQIRRRGVERRGAAASGAGPRPPAGALPRPAGSARQRAHGRARPAPLLPVSEPVERLLREAVVRLGLSARAYHRVLKIGRTIADLGGADELSAAHVSEAIQYRSLDGRKATA